METFGKPMERAEAGDQAALLHRGLSFLIREGGRTVGAGAVTAVPG